MTLPIVSQQTLRDRRTAHSRWRPWVALLLVLPALLAGPAFSGGLFLTHEHGAQGHHEHIFVVTAPVDLVAAHHDQHDPHAHGDGNTIDSEHVTDPSGAITAWPLTPWVRPSVSTPEPLGSLGAPKLPASPFAGDVAHFVAPPTRDSASPPTPDHPSGAVRVLRSSGALLI
ncbi:MAG: hypothetical protein H6697_12720 [Myxococcales bacterium]|nr:hypothetical protein [Myxococcales bacterium]